MLYDIKCLIKIVKNIKICKYFKIFLIVSRYNYAIVSIQCFHYILLEFIGAVAQLGERSVRIRKVEGSNPFSSTKISRVISEIGKNIRKLSKQDGLSQQLIFKLFDISNNTGIKLESGGNTEPLIIALQK